MKALQNQLKKELKRGSRASWRRFLNRKAPSPGRKPNRRLKNIVSTKAEGPTPPATNHLNTGNIPQSNKESITSVIRKGRKGDYTHPSSYRPVALENTLAKVVER